MSVLACLEGRRSQPAEAVVWMRIRSGVDNIPQGTEGQPRVVSCSLSRQIAACVERKLLVRVIETDVSNRNRAVAILSDIDPFRITDATVSRWISSECRYSLKTNKQFNKQQKSSAFESSYPIVKMSPFLIPCNLFTASCSFCNSRSTSSSSSSLFSIGGVGKALGNAAATVAGCCSSLVIFLLGKSSEIGRNMVEMERFPLKSRNSSCHGSIKRRMFCRVNHCSSCSFSSGLNSSAWWLLLESLKSMANSKRVGCLARIRPQRNSCILLFLIRRTATSVPTRRSWQAGILSMIIVGSWGGCWQVDRARSTVMLGADCSRREIVTRWESMMSRITPMWYRLKFCLSRTRTLWSRHWLASSVNELGEGVDEQLCCCQRFFGGDASSNAI